MAITISGSGIVEANIANGAVSSDKLATGIDATKLADGTITNSELQYINSLSSNAQTQISAAGGAWEYLSTNTLSTASTSTFSSLNTTTYAGFKVVYINMYGSAGHYLEMQVQEAGGGATLTTNTYHSALVGRVHNTTVNTIDSSPQDQPNTSWRLTIDTGPTAAGNPYNGWVEIYGMEGGGVRLNYHGMMGGCNDGPNGVVAISGGMMNVPYAYGHNGIVLKPDTGTFTGTHHLYGLTKA